MKSYFECKHGAIYHGDCLDIIPRLEVKVDAVICDPPYGMAFRSNRRIEKHAKIKNDDTLKWLPKLTKLLHDVMKDDTAVFLLCSHHKIDIFKQELEKMFNIKNLCVWLKNNHSMGDLEGSFGSMTEFCWFATKGNPKINGERPKNVFQHAGTGNTYHPTEKPIALMSNLVKPFTKQGHIILDPYMGSGTTAVAAINTNRRFIGIELEEKYCEIAAKRIEQAMYGNSLLNL